MDLPPLADVLSDGSQGDPAVATTSDVSAVQQRLAALASDPAALCGEIRKHVAFEARRTAIAHFLQHANSLVMEQVALDLLDVTNALLSEVFRDGSTADGEGTANSAGMLLLLDQLLVECKQRFLAKRESEVDEHVKATTVRGSKEPLVRVMVAYFRAATMRLSSESLAEKERTMLLQWCELVLELVYLEKPSALHGESGEARSAKEDLEPSTDLVHTDRSWIAAIAALLLRLHDTTTQRATSPTGVNFKVMTLVWKVQGSVRWLEMVVLRCCADMLVVNASASVASLSRLGIEESSPFQVDDVMSSVVASMEQCVQQLCADKLSDAKLLVNLKFLRLYWRAFQGQLVCYVNLLTSEVESSLIALVNVASSLVDLSRRSNSRVSVKVQSEAWRLMSLVAGLAEKLGADSSINASTKEQVRVLLWHSDDEMVRAIRQRREMTEGQANGNGNVQHTEASILCGHLLVVAAFGSTDENILPAEDPNEEIGGAKILAAAAMLLQRYQNYASYASVQDLRDPNELFLDFLMGLLLKVDDLEELQLFLIKQAFHPDPSRRFVIWEVWKEFMCYGWDEGRACAVLGMLLDFGQWEGTTAKIMADGAQSDVYALIAFLYPDMPDSLKRCCIDQATHVIDAICSEGPDHKFTLQTASQLNLLERLSSVSFLKNYDHPEKEEWIAKYLPMCFECCGTVLDLLNSTSDTKPSEKRPMMRILDVCLLAVKAIFDDDDTRESDFEELCRLLVPMNAEILTQLGKSKGSARVSAAASNSMTSSYRSRTTPTIVDIKLDRETDRTLLRVLETCTHLLGRLGTAFKRNQSNQFVLALKDMSQLLEQAPPQHESSGVAASIAWFAKNALYDVQVAEGDMEVVWQLFTRLFRNLSSPATAAAGGGKTILSPRLSTTFDAFYQFVAHSNVASHQSSGANRHLQKMLHENVKELFKEFLSLKKISREEAGVACSSAIMTSAYRAQTKRQHQRLLSERFPEEEGGRNGSSNSLAKRGYDALMDDAPHSGETSAQESNDGGRSRKRQKVETLASMCKRMQEVCAAAHASHRAFDAVSEKELDEAAHILQQLLARTSS